MTRKKLPQVLEEQRLERVLVSEIKHRVDFSRERQEWSRDMKFGAFGVRVCSFYARSKVFPVNKNAKNVSIYITFSFSFFENIESGFMQTVYLFHKLIHYPVSRVSWSKIDW